MVVGGSEPTVSVTGWMLGGGHSPVSPMLGLGVDSVLEIEMVDAAGSVVTMNKDGMTSQLTNGTVRNIIAEHDHDFMPFKIYVYNWKFKYDLL